MTSSRREALVDALCALDHDSAVTATAPRSPCTQGYGKGFETGPPQVGQGRLSFCWFRVVLSFPLGSRPVFLPSRALF